MHNPTANRQDGGMSSFSQGIANDDMTQPRHGAGNVPSFIAHYLEIHGMQARSVRSDLERLRSLIDDASERLMTSFGAIRALSAHYGEAGAGTGDVVMNDVERAVGDAISALQFQDMATQLVGHAAQRISLLEKISESLGRLPEASHDDLSSAVTEILEGRHTSPVEQACMDGGSVELF